MTGAFRDRDARSGRLEAIGAIAISAVWGALLAGIGQGAITAFDAHVRHQIVYASRDVYWMAPLSYGLPFAVLAALLALIALLVPRAMSVRVGTVLCLWLALFSLSLPYGMIARWAAAALSLGAAVAVGRWLTTDASRWPARATRQIWGMAVLIALVAAGTRGWRAWSTHRAVAALPAPNADAPNVVLIILDTMRSANMHIYGYERANTPVLERMAAQSAVFDDAIAPAPWTLPTHAAMFTGHSPDALSSNYVVPLDDAVPTLAERLAAHGFETAGFVANHHYTGFDSGLARGFTKYEDYKVTLKQIMRTAWPMQALYFFDPVLFGGNATIVKNDDDKTLQVPPKSWAHAKRAGEVVDEFLGWQAKGTGRPYFAFLNMYDAHDPRWAPAEVRKRFRYQLPNVELYDAAMAYMDREIGRMLDTLSARGTLERTVVIVASDHGELFGEHQLWGHANNLYLDVLRVPLIVRFPTRVAGGTRVTRTVSLQDVAATISDLAGLPRESWLPGNTLVPVMNSLPDAETSPVISFAHQTINLSLKFPTARGEMYGVIDDSLHYIRNTGDNGEELFAWKVDRKEARDLSKTPEAQGHLQRMRLLARRAAGPEGGQGR